MVHAPGAISSPSSDQDERPRRLSRRDQEEALDEGLQDSFPASDPVSISQPTTAMPINSQLRLSATGDWVRRQTWKAIRRAAAKTPPRHGK
jgi:hypothetical protein